MVLFCDITVQETRLEEIAMEPRGLELIARYKRNYSIPRTAEITEEMILAHWDLERRLAQELLGSTAENRWEVFEKCYTRLYSELPWLNALTGQEDRTAPEVTYRCWLEVIGSPPQTVYEIGSGKGEMITYLSDCGFRCKGTEITRERGAKFVDASYPNLSWGSSDGVHLDRFEPSGAYDVVLSNQVIEHIHPDDLDAHLKGAFTILSEKGKYIFNTPHAFTGPADVSKVFNCVTPKGMHLKEYTFRELKSRLLAVGFSRVDCVPPSLFWVPLEKTGLKNKKMIDAACSLYLSVPLTFEWALSIIPAGRPRKTCATLLRRILLFPTCIFIRAYK